MPFSRWGAVEKFKGKVADGIKGWVAVGEVESRSRDVEVKVRHFGVEQVIDTGNLEDSWLMLQKLNSIQVYLIAPQAAR